MDGRMIKPFVLLCIFIVYTESSLVSPRTKSCGNYRYSAEFRTDKCHADGLGYYTCAVFDDPDLNAKEVEVKSIKCPKGARCQCFIKDYSVRPCHCVSSTNTPSFPSVGIIRWEGDYKHYDFDVHFKQHGEAHKNGNGNYLLKYIDDEAKEVVEIVIQEKTGTFIKYKVHNATAKECRKYNVDYEGQLSSVWRNRDGWSLISKGEDYYDTRKDEWRKYERVDDYGGKGDYKNDWTWKVTYDSVQNHAIPIYYRHYRFDVYEHYSYLWEYNYSYERIGNDEKTFRLEDYCVIDRAKDECDVKK